MAICLTPTDPLPRAVYVLNGFEPSKHKNVSVSYIFYRCWNGAGNAVLPHGIHRDQRKSQKWPYTCLLSFRAYSHFVRTHFSLPRVSVKKLQRLTLNLVDAFTMRLTWPDLLLGALCGKHITSIFCHGIAFYPEDSIRNFSCDADRVMPPCGLKGYDPGNVGICALNVIVTKRTTHSKIYISWNGYSQTNFCCISGMSTSIWLLHTSIT